MGKQESKKLTFEDFLAEKHAKQYKGLDDEMPDDFNNWLVEVEQDSIIKYADEYAKAQERDMLKKIRQIVIEDVPHKYQDRLLEITK